MEAFATVWQTVAYVATFWYNKLFGWFRSKSPKRIWMDKLANAQEYEDWELAALQLDKLFGFDLWREASASRYYDWQLIKDRLQLLHDTRTDPVQHHRLPNLIRSGLVRNLGNITSPKLYNCSFAGTKLIIEEYIAQVIFAIEDILSMPITPTQPGSVPTSPKRAAAPLTTMMAVEGSGTVKTEDQAAAAATPTPTPTPAPTPTALPSLPLQTKMTFIHNTRQAFGRTCLILQGGSIFGMCHLGVVKALFLRGLLPQVITGTATGALIATLVAVHTDEELPAVLSGDGIDLSAFTKNSKAAMQQQQQQQQQQQEGGGGGVNQSLGAKWTTLLRRLRRFREKGYFLDMEVLEQCVRDNVGDLTFQEAFRRTNRVLNITIATSEQGGVPAVLNHITSPHVLIWTAAAASNKDFPSLYGRETPLLCKRPSGEIERWGPANAINFRHWTQASYGHGGDDGSERHSPLRRVAELFNVNSFIISQARPYVIPFLQPDMHSPRFIGRGGFATTVVAFLVKVMSLELRHRLRQLDTVHLLPTSIRRFLVDDRIPGTGLTLVPEVRFADFPRLLEVPTQDTLRYWILIGERSVWPALSALEIRCAIEMKLDWAYKRTKKMNNGGWAQQQHQQRDQQREQPQEQPTAGDGNGKEDGGGIGNVDAIAVKFGEGQ